ERGVQHSDRVAEARPEAPDGLGRERDLGNENDDSTAALERGCGRLQVDLGLPAAGWAREKYVTAAGVQRCDDAFHRSPLVGRELCRLSLSSERLARNRRGTLPAPLRQCRSDELEGARRCRAEVVGKPECEIYEKWGNVAEPALDLDRHDTRGRDDVNLGDDAAGGAAAEPDRDDVPLLDLVRHRVR